MKIEICVGSSCHVRGSYEVVKNVEAFVKDQELDHEIELKGCFCMGHCTEGVSVKIDGGVLQVSEENVVELLEEKLRERKNAAD
ncbi:(2Fe-2S) ferredoxin domain-containing protein [Proteiniclasticum ruminis]|uniref:Thioredoxin-like [2Fe-2S] ferredoxin n=1 Tax=Proteiniclasticum ruminis TaxID=398199 RepID=A0A1G8GYQ1_9CLOT|nr:(2Fe-2S) ferredoxin domain-containing protein [Proteiniclasticum ruminis]SDH99360.1 Thioredoxin-like [2Fe-2S] ferredoxin [Proteiniclasticum ruminis]